MKQGIFHYKGRATEAGEALLLDYAAGSLNEALSLVVSTHLSMSSSSRDFVKHCESIGGHLLLTACEPVGVSSKCLESVLAQLDKRSDEYHDEYPENGHRYEFDGMYIPSPLSTILSSDACNAKDWHKIVKGIESFDLLRCDTSHAQLLRMAPAITAPAHSHAGLEVTLILDGAFSDETGEYNVGDLIVEDETTIHAPVSCPRQGCVCLAVTTAPIRLTGWMGRLINPFLR
jgi:putative transcriptional regulator